MMDRVESNGVVFYRSSLLAAAGVPHAFSTRVGGISPPPFDTMNLGNPNGCDIQDDYQHIWANYRTLQAAAGCPGRELCRVHQVHGNAVVRAVAGQPFDTSARADAIVGDDPARVLSVRVADCVPVLMSTRDGSTVAAIHAGWRGVVAGVAIEALKELLAIHNSHSSRSGRTEGPLSSAQDVVAAIGPSIGFDAFEVGPEVLQEFRRTFGADAPLRARDDGKGHVDLRETLRRQLTREGIPADQIDVTDRCTCRDRDEFFSHRRDNGITGRMAAVISPRG